jgi:antagonist of KipI
MSITVLKPGLLTTLQDRGRYGCAMLGVGRAGAMDDVAMRLANALVGNSVDAAVLEITLIGPRLRFDEDATIALTGADFPARIDDTHAAMWQPIAVEAGAVLDCGAARHGSRAYLAIAGGFVVEPTLGSVSTDVNARLGGFDGRALREGDVLVVGNGASPELGATTSSSGMRGTALAGRTRNAHSKGSRETWSLDPRPWFDADGETPIRLIRGAHFEALNPASRAALFDAEFRIDKDSNRVGFRLDGPALALAAPLELVSEPLVAGTLQLPPGGQPIALMVEHPTIGGYPRIGQIVTVDLPRLAQRRPGDPVRFAEIDLDAAQTRYLERERELLRLIEAIGERLTS